MIGHLCNQDHCREYGCIELKKQARHLYTKPTLTTLQQFNEEVKKKFDDYIEKSEIINSNFIKEFITQKLTEHKALILKMVREKMPDEEYCSSQNSTPIAYGYNSYRQEFLNNLDTI